MLWNALDYSENLQRVKYEANIKKSLRMVNTVPKLFTTFHSNIPDYSRRFQSIPECFATLRTILEISNGINFQPKKVTNVPEHSTTFECSEIFHNELSDVHECSRLFPNMPQNSRMFLIVLDQNALEYFGQIKLAKAKIIFWTVYRLPFFHTYSLNTVSYTLYKYTQIHDI